MDKKNLYSSFFKAFKNANPNLPHQTCDSKVSERWKQLKNGLTFEADVKQQILDWNYKASQSKAKLDEFWNSAMLSKPKDNTSPASTSVPAETIPCATDQTLPSTTENSVTTRDAKIPPTPVQEQLRKSISNLQADLGYLQRKKEQGIASEEELEKLKKSKSELHMNEVVLRKRVADQGRQQRKRAQDKRILENLKENNPEVAAALQKRPKSGRPPLEDGQPELLKAIVDIATYGSGTDERRRSEKIHTVKTLDELTDELQLKGFKIKRSAVYLRLLPRNSMTLEGKRHVTTVPVRLVRATNDIHKLHSDTKFCTATIRFLEEVASILGPHQTIFISQDDKARVPIGKTAANKQTPLLMHLDYRVRLPDHDWVVAEKHKLIPSVYALIKVNEDKLGEPSAVTYSGPTFITIRSGKHSSSTAFSHARDLEVLLQSNDFSEFCWDSEGIVKPVLIITVDGGPDENPRYEKTIISAIHHFKKYNLDAFLLATNAPGRSAYNRVERRMAPLSRDLAGLILDHEILGSHLNGKGETIDSDLERKNFHAAGNVLAEIWSQTVIDGYQTVAKFVDPEDSEVTIDVQISSDWRSRHVREGHYFLQVVKCSDLKCCSKPRSSYFKFLKQFIPAPLCVSQKDGLMVSDNQDESNKFTSLLLRLTMSANEYKKGSVKEVPFDLCCPSLRDLIDSRTCDKCGIYHGTKKSLTSHRRACKIPASTSKKSPEIVLPSRVRPKRVAAMRQKEKMVVWVSRLNDKHADWFDDDEVDDVQDLDNDDSAVATMPVIDIDNYMQNRWEELKD